VRSGAVDRIAPFPEEAALPRITLLLCTLLLAAPAAAQAAAPAVTTGGAARVTQTTATLTGSVDPNRRATEYRFNYGASQRLGTVTPWTAAGSGDARVPAVADITGLPPGTRVFYRLIARNADGTTRGDIRSFRTRPEPTALELTAAPNPVTFGGTTVFSGRLAGTDNAGQPVTIERRDFPYTGAWVATGLQGTTAADGAFAFPPAGVPVTAQFRAVAPRRGNLRSAVATVEVALRVGTATSATRVRRGARLKFHGSIRPARPGAPVGIQKRTSTGRWVTVAGTFTRGGNRDFSTYTRTIRPPRGGTYRIFIAVADGNYVSAAGREIRISTYR
jgi:hypothetical protein